MRLYRFLLAAFLLLYANSVFGQILVHSHNDYSHKEPFWGAFRERANSIEADVFPVNSRLMVAHAKEAIQPQRTLESMYLDPIINLFKKHQNKWVSDDTSYTFYLMIDIKEKWDTVLPLLIAKLQQHPDCFNREVNPKAVQVFISGDRPPDTTFHSYPPEIMFDGLPGKKYQPADLKKVVMISTDFHLYSPWNGKGKLPIEDADKIKKIVVSAHNEHKPVRFWGAPDTEDCWRTLLGLGADVINTDHVKACKLFLKAYQ